MKSISKKKIGPFAAIATLAIVIHSGPTALAAQPETPQREINRALVEHPGGTQVSDNAVVWGEGDVVMVFPDPGEARAPEGLGSSVDLEKLGKIGAEHLSQPAPADVEGCPSGYTSKDYYCFYYHANWGGTRKQFAETCTSTAEEWGFDNETSSWVATDIDKTIITYGNKARTQYLWRMPENSKVSFVGAANNDKMSAWTCNE